MNKEIRMQILAWLQDISSRFRCRLSRSLLGGLGLSVVVLVFIIGRTIQRDPQTAAAERPAAPGQLTADNIVVPATQRALPTVPGRHDRIHKDIFVVKDGVFCPDINDQDFSTYENAWDRETHGVSQAGNPSPLKAIVWDKPPKAFINDSLVGVGEFVELHGFEHRMYQVTCIREGSVTLQCKGETIELQLASNNG